MKKKLLISLLVFTGLLIIAILIAYLTILFRKPTVNNLKNNQKAITQQATTTNVVNAFNAGNYDESLKLANAYLQKHPKEAQALAAKAKPWRNQYPRFHFGFY